MTNNNTEGENLSRIKEILFGEDLTGIDDKFELFKKESSENFSKLELEFRKKIEELEKLIGIQKNKVEKKHESSNEVQQTINETVKTDISKIAEKVQEEKNKFRELLIKTEEETKIQVQKLEENVQSSLERIKNESYKRIDELNNTKVSSEVLADIFQGVAEKLRK